MSVIKYSVLKKSLAAEVWKQFCRYYCVLIYTQVSDQLIFIPCSLINDVFYTTVNTDASWVSSWSLSLRDLAICPCFKSKFAIVWNCLSSLQGQFVSPTQYNSTISDYWAPTGSQALCRSWNKMIRSLLSWDVHLLEGVRQGTRKQTKHNTISNSEKCSEGENNRVLQEHNRMRGPFLIGWPGSPFWGGRFLAETWRMNRRWLRVIPSRGRAWEPWSWKQPCAI